MFLRSQDMFLDQLAHGFIHPTNLPPHTTNNHLLTICHMEPYLSYMAAHMAQHITSLPHHPTPCTWLYKPLPSMPKPMLILPPTKCCLSSLLAELLAAPLEVLGVPKAGRKKASKVFDAMLHSAIKEYPRITQPARRERIKKEKKIKPSSWRGEFLGFAGWKRLSRRGEFQILASNPKEEEGFFHCFVWRKILCSSPLARSR